jgi:hypothetical protein
MTSVALVIRVSELITPKKEKQNNDIHLGLTSCAIKKRPSRQTWRLSWWFQSMRHKKKGQLIPLIVLVLQAT